MIYIYIYLNASIYLYIPLYDCYMTIQRTPFISDLTMASRKNLGRHTLRPSLVVPIRRRKVPKSCEKYLHFQLNR